jgi:hypothetical protein
MTNNAPLGKLFVSLEPTQEEVWRIGGSRAVYQQLIILNIIEEFGFDIEVIVQVPPIARFEINRGIILFPRVTTGPEWQPAEPGQWRPIRKCIKLGFLKDFLIIRRVPEQTRSRIEQEYRNRWQTNSSIVAGFEATITPYRQ